jgi:hypothetical protein
MPDTATMNEVRNKMWYAYKYVERLTFEVETLRKDETTATGEVRNAIALLIQDKLFKIENAVIHLSHNILHETLPDNNEDWRLREIRHQ